MVFFTHLPRTTAGLVAKNTFDPLFSKRIDLILSGTSNDASRIANCFDKVSRLHGLPDSTESDGDPKLTVTVLGRIA